MFIHIPRRRYTGRVQRLDILQSERDLSIAGMYIQRTLGWMPCVLDEEAEDTRKHVVAALVTLVLLGV